MRACVFQIILMIPIFAVNAQSSLKETAYHGGEFNLPELFVLVRELYEAVTIVAFVQLLVIWLGGPSVVAQAFVSKMQKPQHVWLTLFPSMKGSCVDRLVPMPYRAGYGLVSGVLMGILQFAILTCVLSFVNASIWIYGYVQVAYKHQDAEVVHATMKAAGKVPQAIKGLSVMWAMYNLLLLFLEVGRNESLKHKFEKIKPEGKFICIKAVIGFTALQKVVCEQVLPYYDVYTHYLPHDGDWTPEQAAAGVQNFLLCCELLLFAVLYLFAWPLSEFGEQAQSLERASTTSFHGFAKGGPLGMMMDLYTIRRLAEKQNELIRKLGKRDTTAEELREIFEFFLIDQDDQISIQEFEYMLQASSHLDSDEEIKEWSDRADENKNGYITEREFMDTFLARNDGSPSRQDGLKATLLGQGP